MSLVCARAVDAADGGKTSSGADERDKPVGDELAESIALSTSVAWALVR